MIAYLLRVIGDTSTSLGWARWATPFGWSEEARAFAEPRPGVLALPLVTGAAMLIAAGLMAGRRDIGTGLLPARDRAEPRLWLLSSPTALALREELVGIIVWAVALGIFATVVGVLSTSFTAANLPANVQRAAEQARDLVDHHAPRCARFLLPALRARDQPVRLLPDRSSAP